jgi:hypothetical protein
MKLLLSYGIGIKEDIDPDIQDWCNKNDIVLQYQDEYPVDELGTPSVPIVETYIDLSGVLLTEFLMKF